MNEYKIRSQDEALAELRRAYYEPMYDGETDGEVRTSSHVPFRAAWVPGWRYRSDTDTVEVSDAWYRCVMHTKLPCRTCGVP